MGVGGKQRCWERTSNSLIMYRVCCFKGCRCVSSVENIPPTSERGRDEMVQKEWRLLKLGSRSAPAPAHTWGRPARHVREVLLVRRSKLGLDCLNKTRGLTLHG